MMKSFNCGKCKSLYSFDEQKIEHRKFAVICKICGIKNIVDLEPKKALIPQTKAENIAAKPANKKIKVMANIVYQGNTNQIGLNLGSNIIGRKAMVHDRFLSSKHCDIRLHIKQGQLIIEIIDLKSTNGSFDFNKNKLIPLRSYVVKLNRTYYIGQSKISITL